MVSAVVLIELRDVIFGFPGGERILDGTSFSVKDGERIGLTGGNGAGKSTLFQIALGLLRPEGGAVVLWGKECRREEDFREGRRRIGLVFQDPDDQLFCPSVIEDVAFGPMNLGLSALDARERSYWVLEGLGIPHLADRPPHHLSGGEKRLVSIATVLSMEPEVLFLDEPTEGLDEVSFERVISVIKGYPARALVAVSHDPAVLDALTTTRHVLKGGRISRA